VLAEGLRHAGGDPTGERVQKALEVIGGFDRGGFRIGSWPNNRVGLRHVDITVAGKGGRLPH
jgi:hypothetical protein